MWFGSCLASRQQISFATCSSCWCWPTTVMEIISRRRKTWKQLQINTKGCYHSHLCRISYLVMLNCYFNWSNYNLMLVYNTYWSCISLLSSSPSGRASPMDTAHEMPLNLTTLFVKPVLNGMFTLDHVDISLVIVCVLAGIEFLWLWEPVSAWLWACGGDTDGQFFACQAARGRPKIVCMHFFMM